MYLDTQEWLKYIFMSPEGGKNIWVTCCSFKNVCIVRSPNWGGWVKTRECVQVNLGGLRMYSDHLRLFKNGFRSSEDDLRMGLDQPRVIYGWVYLTGG